MTVNSVPEELWFQSWRGIYVYSVLLYTSKFKQALSLEKWFGINYQSFMYIRNMHQGIKSLIKLNNTTALFYLGMSESAMEWMCLRFYHSNYLENVSNNYIVTKLYCFNKEIYCCLKYTWQYEPRRNLISPFNSLGISNRWNRPTIL